METFRSFPRPVTGVAARHTKNLSAEDRRRMEGNKMRVRSIMKSEIDSEGSALIWKILKNEKYLRIMTGMMFLMYLEFEAGFVERALRGRHGPLFRDNRRRSRDPGRRRKLDPRQVLVMYLVWMRTGMTQDELSVYFGIDQSTVSRYLRIARDVLKYNSLNPASISRMIRGARTTRDVQKWIPGGMLYCDGTNVEVPRPVNEKRRRASYSCKRKNFSITFLVVANDDGLVIGLSAARPGSVHDMRVVREGFPDWGRWSRYMLDPGNPDGRRFIVWADSGYEGLWKVFEGADVNFPYKKLKGEDLPAWQKKYNRWLARNRIHVEHVIGRMKSNGALHRPYEGDAADFDVDADCIAGIENFKLAWRKRRLTRERGKRRWLESVTRRIFG